MIARNLGAQMTRLISFPYDRSVSKFKHKTTEKKAQCELFSFGSEVERIYMLLRGRTKKNYSPPKNKIK